MVSLLLNGRGRRVHRYNVFWDFGDAEMTEPIKLPPFKWQMYQSVPAGPAIRMIEDYARLAVEQNIEQATADLYSRLTAAISSRNDWQTVAGNHAKNCTEWRIQARKAETERDEATKDRDDVLASYADACKQLLEAEKAGDEARAELARLTTLRPASEHDPNEDGYARWFFHKDDYWAEVGSDHRKPQYATHWTPLSPVKEPR
jgi:hypothetical protein